MSSTEAEHNMPVVMPADAGHVRCPLLQPAQGYKVKGHAVLQQQQSRSPIPYSLSLFVLSFAIPFGCAVIRSFSHSIRPSFFLYSLCSSVQHASNTHTHTHKHTQPILKHSALFPRRQQVDGAAACKAGRRVSFNSLSQRPDRRRTGGPWP